MSTICTTSSSVVYEGVQCLEFFIVSKKNELLLLCPFSQLHLRNLMQRFIHDSMQLLGKRDLKLIKTYPSFRIGLYFLSLKI